MNAQDHGLGRRPLPPGDDVHLRKYSLPQAAPDISVERVLPFRSSYRSRYDQGNTSACVGFSSSWAMSILNHEYYDAPWLFHEALKVDEWPGEDDNNGTSVRAGMDVLRTLGHRQVYRGRDRPVDPNNGILRNEWATSVDQVRKCIAGGTPVVLGIEWFDTFFAPERVGSEYWIGRKDGGRIAGGHAICCYGASDKRQAVRLINSWGTGYPLVWLPYDTLQRLIDGFEAPGEATVIVDRPER
jgi:hypothetical protein